MKSYYKKNPNLPIGLSIEPLQFIWVFTSLIWILAGATGRIEKAVNSNDNLNLVVVENFCHKQNLQSSLSLNKM